MVAVIGGLDVGLLGPFTLHVDGRAVPVPSQQQRVVLARLALSADRVVTGAELVDTLWSDVAPANATGNLHSYLSRLRRLVGADRIIHEHGGYRPAVYAGDVTTAETVLDRARAWAADHGAPTDIAVAHYATGELLGPETKAIKHYEQAIALTRDVGSTFVEGIATVGLASVQAAAGRPDDALRLYERVVRHWLRTGNWTQQWTTLRNLATLLADLGDQSTADVLVGAAARAPAAATDKPTQRRHLSAPDEGPTVPRRHVVAIVLDAITRTQAGRERSGGAC
jgi:tetratricopeptide (TPR) repeat protein